MQPEDQFCRQCGHAKVGAVPATPQPKRGFLGKLLFVGFGILGLLVVTASILHTPSTNKVIASPVAKEAETTAVVQQPAEKIRWLRPSEMVGAYEHNEVAADKYFKGEVFAVKGRVKEISKDMLGSPYVTLTDDALSASSSFRVVQAAFSRNDEDILASLRPGQMLTVACKVQGLMMNVQLSGCRVPDKSEVGENVWKK